MVTLKRPLWLPDYNGGTMGSTALEMALADARRDKHASCRIGWRGALTLTRQPPLLNGIHMEGDDIISARVIKDFPGGQLFRFEGGPPGGGLHNFCAPVQPGTANSHVVLIRATADLAPDSIQLEHLYLSSHSGSAQPAHAPWRNIEISGVARPGLGIRQVRITNVTCFGSSAAGNVYLAGCVDLLAVGLRIYPAGGLHGDLIEGPGNDFLHILGGLS